MTGDPRWFVRMRGEEKDITTVWLTLGQRTMRYETYVMPAPEENAAELYEHLLRRNERLVGAHFAIGIEDAVFLRGELPDVVLTEAELDRILGTLYATVEQMLPGPAPHRLRQPPRRLTVPASSTSPPTGSGPGGSSRGSRKPPTDPPGHAAASVRARGSSSWWSWVAATWVPHC